MSHKILLKHGWQPTFTTKRFTVYALGKQTLIVWNTGKVVRL